jgi:hypothetical protein
MPLFLLQPAGRKAKELCGILQLCAGLEAGIEGSIHAIKELWKQHEEEEEWGFLLVDASNAFNKLNQTAMLWTIQHEWPYGAPFAFNCYCHWASLVIRGKGGTSVLLYSVTQGDPLSMFGYGIGILPLIRRLKHEFPAVKQPWYTDDAGTRGCFTDLRNFFLRLQEIGPTYGYFPEPTKSILIVRAHNRTIARSLKTCNLKYKPAAATLVATLAPEPTGNCGSRTRSPSGPVR